MAGITAAQATTNLTKWLQASEDIADRGQSAAIKGRSLTRANTGEVLRMIEFWDKKCKQLAAGGIRVKRSVPVYGDC